MRNVYRACMTVQVYQYWPTTHVRAKETITAIEYSDVDKCDEDAMPFHLRYIHPIEHNPMLRREHAS